MGKTIPLKLFPQFSLDCGNNITLEQNPDTTIFVLDSLLHVMNMYLPIHNAPHAIITFLEAYPNPTCLRNPKLIILTTNPFSWNQLAYQLAHEMCHYIIPNDVSHNLKWFEESICELSSYYFLPQLSEYWKRMQIPLLRGDTNSLYYPEFQKYVEYEQLRETFIDISTFVQHENHPELLSLIKNCEQRDKNTYIANRLLPVFIEFPCTWHAVPLLYQISPNQSLRDSLSQWIALSPMDAHIGLQKLAQVFGAEVPLNF